MAMWLVMGCWILAMISGLLWATHYTLFATAVTLVLWVVAQPAMLLTWPGWLQMATLAITPTLLAAQRRREVLAFNALRTQEAEQLALLSDAARTLFTLRSSTQQVESQITDITNLYHVTKETSGTLHLNELCEALARMIPRLLHVTGLRVVECGEPRQVFRMTTERGQLIVQEAKQLLDVEQAIVEHATATGTSGSGTPQTLGCEFPEGVMRVAWAPLWRKQQLEGLIIADDLPEEELKTLTIIAHQLSLQWSRIHLYRRVEALAVTDALTDLFVRSHFLGRAEEELVRCRHHGLPCTLVMTDLDLFKQKNDTYGHLVGDVVLKDVARLLKRNLREIDLIARFGGEEFILLLIETDVEHAFPIAERLRQLVEVHPIRAYDELLTQTISIGLAGFPNDAGTLEALIERADQALYQAKRAGRNRVMRWSKSLQPA